MTADQVQAELVRLQQLAMQRQQEQGALPESPHSEPVTPAQHGQQEAHQSPTRWIPPQHQPAGQIPGQTVGQQGPQDGEARQRALLEEKAAWKRFQKEPNLPIPHLIISNCNRTCGKCDHAVPDYAQLGEKCPWCGTVWQYETDYAGKVIDRTRPPRTSLLKICAGIGLWALLFLVIGVAIRIVRAITGQA